MRALPHGMVLALLLLMACASCSRPQRAIGEAQLSDGRLSLSASTADPDGLPLYDRVDLVLLPAQPDSLLREYPGSTEYFDAIRSAGGFYIGGDYIDEAERSSGSAVYELDAPAGALPDGQQGWLLLLLLEGTAVTVDGFRPASGLN